MVKKILVLNSRFMIWSDEHFTELWFSKISCENAREWKCPSERKPTHCATQETKPLMWLIFPRMIHKSKIKKNRFNGHLHLFFVNLQICKFLILIFLFREYVNLTTDLNHCFDREQFKKLCKIRIQNRVLIISPQVDPRLPQLIWGYSLSCW